MKNLILGIVDNYVFHVVRNFFSSLKETHFDGHICIFAGPNTGTRTVSRLEKIGVEVIRYEDDFPYIPNPHPDNVKALPNPIHLYNFRHYLYLDYLLKHKDQFDNIMITDVRDVVFQINPFAFDMQNSICVAMESPSRTIGEDFFNSKWIRIGYGEETLKKLSKNVISCAGTTFASMDLMMVYIKIMLKEIQKLPDAYNTADQGIHNVLIYSDQLKPLKKLFNYDGPVLSIANSAEYKLNDENLVINQIGQVVNTIHQYDRHAELRNLFTKRYFNNSFLHLFERILYKLSP